MTVCYLEKRLKPIKDIIFNYCIFAMPLTEAIVAVYVIYEMVKYTKQLHTEQSSRV